MNRLDFRALMFISVCFFIAVLLEGCSTTVPIVAKFPDVPKELTTSCPKLKTIVGEDISIVDMTKTVTENYTTYYECATVVDGWIEWYNGQKRIFDSIK